MSDRTSVHPENGKLSDFVEGRLSGDELMSIASHLTGCGECRDVVSGAAEFEHEERRRRTTRITTWLAAAAAIVIGIVLVAPRVVMRSTSPVAQLIDAAPKDHRLIPARLSGFAWARLEPPKRGTSTPAPSDLEFAGVAGKVLTKVQSDEKPDPLHAKGLALLVAGERDDAIAALQKAAETSNDARVWSDLAAAQYSSAVAESSASKMALALPAADRAMRLDPRLPEALFNRALIIEGLNDRAEARRAWQAYLAVEPTGGWSNEAREHLGRLRDTGAKFDPKLLTTTPVERLANIVRDFPQESRTWGEGRLLASWADAIVAGDASKASEILARARAVGDALAARGEHLLADSVAAIDRGDAPARATIADAHRLYAGGRVDFHERREAEAESKLRRASALFERSGSPMAIIASLYAATSAIHQARGDDEMKALVSRIDRTRYRAAAAQAEWELAVHSNTIGDWTAAIRHAAASTEAYTALGELQNAAQVAAVGSVTREIVGDTENAWRDRLTALSALSGPEWSSRRDALLYGGALALALTGRDDAAASVAALSHANGSDHFLSAQVLLNKARLAQRVGDAAAVQALAEAARAVSVVPAGALRDDLDAELMIARGVAEHRGNTSAFEDAIRIMRDRHLEHLLPDAHLQAARAAHAHGEDAAATRHYLDGLAEIDRQQQSLGGPAQRLALLDTAGQLFDDAIAMQLDRGATGEALSLAERAHGGDAANATRVHGVALEYVLLPGEIAIFTVDAGTVTAQRVPVRRRDVANVVERFASRIQRHEAAAADGERLFEWLIGPVAATLSRHDSVVIVPDRELNGVPFAALYDRLHRQYLVEQLAISVAPTISESDVAASVAPAVVFGEPLVPGETRLDVARAEAERIAAISGSSVIAGAAATRDAFERGVRDAALIHFSGHAREQSLLLADATVACDDVRRLSLQRHPLVVLAGCGTLRGEHAHVGGTPSLARAFLDAGARAVVATLWEIEDDSAPLFITFHERLHAGVAPSRALRDAQLAMLRSSDARLTQPAAWAPVELITRYSQRRTS